MPVAGGDPPADWIRITSLGGPTTDPAVVARGALAVLNQRFTADRPVRLLGVRVEFAAPDPAGYPG